MVVFVSLRQDQFSAQFIKFIKHNFAQLALGTNLLTECHHLFGISEIVVEISENNIACSYTVSSVPSPRPFGGYISASLTFFVQLD